jgi:glycerophosphoryl diester phosphodiesterase
VRVSILPRDSLTNNDPGSAYGVRRLGAHSPGQGPGSEGVQIAQRDAIPIVIAHRGASGYLPEHTLPAYSTAAMLGADYIELDLVSTRDGQLITRHDNVLDLTTNVAALPEYRDRQTEKIVDGRVITGWFSEDFTLEEIRKLRAIERIPAVRPANTRFDGHYGVPTLEEVITTIQALQSMLTREIGLYIELKHPTYFDGIGLPMETTLIDGLRDGGYHDAHHKVYLQSFEIESLRRLNEMTDLRLVQLLGDSGQPFDVQAAGGALTFDDMATADGLLEIRTYADGVGPEKTHFLIPRNDSGNLALEDANDFIQQAHAANLVVHPYTFRAENQFLPVALRTSADATELGSATQELAVFLALGIDGFFTDHTDIGVAARDRHLRRD